MLRFISETLRGFASHQCKYGVLFLNIERQKKSSQFVLGDRLELWPSKHTLQMVNNNKDKDGSVKLIELRSLLDLNSHRRL